MVGETWREARRYAYFEWSDLTGPMSDVFLVRVVVILLSARSFFFRLQKGWGQQASGTSLSEAEK